MRLKAGPVLTGLLVLLVIIGAVTGFHSGSRQKAEQERTAPAPLATSTPGDRRSSRASLVRRMRSFLKAYYLLKPSDTTANRRARVASFVPLENQQKFLQDLGLTVSTTTEADQARITGGWVQSAKNIKVGTLAPSSYDPKTMVVGASLNVSVNGPDGKKVGPAIRTQVASLWQKQSGRWVLRSFKEGGDTE